MFSETLEELLNELDGFNYEIFWSHERSLPDCFNIPTEEALKDPDVFAVLFCEDDMILPKGVLRSMFDKNYPVVALDYPFRSNGDSTMWRDPSGQVFWSGTGFLLVAKAVLEKLEKPIWKTGHTWEVVMRGETIYLWPHRLKKIAYGLHDVNFGMTLYSSQMPIMDAGLEGGQRKLRKLGRAKVNNGAHDIKELTIIGKDIVIKTFNPEHIKRYKWQLSQVRHVEVLDKKPSWAGYDADGKVFIKSEHIKGKDYLKI